MRLFVMTFSCRELTAAALLEEPNMTHLSNENTIPNSTDPHSRFYLKPQCGKCFGLCCAVLYFSALDGFPENKRAGTPCPNLKEDFRCSVHGQLGALGYKGCAAYDCFGAGQLVSQVTFGGHDWRKEPSSTGIMFDAFVKMRQLNEMCWYLYDALAFVPRLPIHKELIEALRQTENLTLL